MLAWHVAIVTPGREGFALRDLAGVTGTAGCAPPVTIPPGRSDAFYETIWPRWVDYRQVRGREVEAVRPLASGYVIVKFDATDATEWHEVRARCGDGARFVGGEEPVPVVQSEIDKLLAEALSADGLLPTPKERRLNVAVAVGDYLKSAVLDLSGFVVWLDERGCRVRASFFGREVPAWFPHGTYVQSEAPKPEENPGRWRSVEVPAGRQFGRSYKNALRRPPGQLYAAPAQRRTVAPVEP